MLENLTSLSAIPELEATTIQKPKDLALSLRKSKVENALELSHTLLLKSSASVCETLFLHAAERRKQQREFAEEQLKNIYSR